MILDIAGVESVLSERSLIDEHQDHRKYTVYGFSNGLCSVSCLWDEHVETCGWDKLVLLYNLQG